MAKKAARGAKPPARKKVAKPKAAKRQTKAQAERVLKNGPIRKGARATEQPRLQGVDSDPRLKNIDKMHADLYRILVRQADDRADADGLKQSIQNEMKRLALGSRTSNGVVSKLQRGAEWDFSSKLADPVGKKTGKNGGAPLVDAKIGEATSPGDVDAMDAVDDGPRDVDDDGDEIDSESEAADLR